tara:strand:+ start:349 stop:555 length:207 start_codon:yes stop_codon:yes gene_type:complete
MNKLKELTKSSLEITYELFIIMIPTLIIVKILDEIGFVEILNKDVCSFNVFVGITRGYFISFYHINVN